MAWVAVAVAGSTLIGGMMSADAQSSAAQSASDAQVRAAQLGVDEQRREFDLNQQLTQQGIDERRARFADVQRLLQPFVQSGTGALQGQMDILGVNGPEAQQAVYDRIQQSPAFQSQLKLGENRILANASATGGLRSGSTQAALGYFAPSMLADLINQRYGQLSGLTGMGLNAAGGVGNAGMAEAAGIGGALGQLGSGAMTLGSNVSSLLQQGGSAQAGAALAGGRAQAGMWNNAAGAFGQYLGAGGSLGGIPAPDAIQARFAQTPAGQSGFGTGAAYGNQDFGAYL